MFTIITFGIESKEDLKNLFLNTEEFNLLK